ncbi:hypothetical protein [Salegentibacter mishustinae]|uniref:hypothetical protein n=1 Tax=Salegentibacter mishustinae TaxID=270918 RepID=UPI0024931DBB|nr:hypothetical protein [Salegentibacter mishustinae]
MSKTITQFYRFLFVTIFLISCSTDESGSGVDGSGDTNDDSGEPITGIAVTTSEIISFEVNTPLRAEEYQGTLGEKNITLVKVDESHLMLVVPSDMEEGISTLKVNGLDVEKHYDVSELKLNGTATETFNDLFSNVTNEINTFESSADSQYVADYWAQVKASFDNASEAEQVKAALFYQANKEMIDDFLQDDYTRQSESDLSILSKHKLAVLAFGAGVTVAILSPDPITKALAAGVAIISWKKAKGYLSYLAEKKLRKINFIFDDLESDLSRQQLQRLEFTHDVSESLSLHVKHRTISSEDQDEANQNLGTFFEGFNLFNQVVEKLNNVIAYVNENLFFSNVEQVDDANLIEDSPISESVDNEIYQKMEFSVGSDEVEIAEISYQDGLKLKFKINDVENLNQDFIDTELNYSYGDDFNDFNSSFDIRVNKETANYKLQIGKYEGYSNPVVIHTLENGDDLTLPNYMTHLVRLTLDDVPVLVGNGSETGWTGSDVIGYYPESNEDINIENYGITVYDATNNKEVTISVNLTLKNYGYNRFVNNSITIDYGSHGEAEGKPKNIFFYPDGTYKYVSNDGSSSHDGTYNYVGIHSSASNIQCQEYQTTDFINSVIQLSGGSDSYYRYRYPKYIMLYEDGTLHTRQSANCQNRPFTWHLY